jgi:hypothetical protein
MRSGWGGHLKTVVHTTSVCTRLLQVSHSNRATTSDKQLHDMQESLENPTIEYGDRPDQSSMGSFQIEQRIGSAIQKALYGCLNHRTQTFLQYPLLDSTDTELCQSTMDAILKSASSMLNHGQDIAILIAEAPRSTRSAWIHFMVSLLRCQLGYASSVGLLVLNRCSRSRNTGGQDSRASSLLPKIRGVQYLMEDTLPVSYEVAKQQTFFGRSTMQPKNSFTAAPTARISI